MGHEKKAGKFEEGSSHNSSPITLHPLPLTHHGRLRWHSRRGMLELDILLQRFWDKFGAELSAADGVELEKLLEQEDNDLLELVLDSSETASRVLQMLRAA